MSDQPSPLELAEQIAKLAADLGIQTAVIGAFALAAHHYVRATRDLDLGTTVTLEQLQMLDKAVRAAGFSAELRTPDDSDPLGGVLVVWDRVDEDDVPVEPVEVVNFINPYRPRTTPATEAIRDALEVPGSALRYPRLHHLIALKLVAGAMKDYSDVIELLLLNPDADLEEIRNACRPYAARKLEELIAEAHNSTRRRS